MEIVLIGDVTHHPQAYVRVHFFVDEMINQVSLTAR